MSKFISRLLNSLFVLTLLTALLLAACSSSSGGGSNEVQITLTEFKIEPSMTTFKTGVTYHFVVTNKGSAPHEVWIMPPADDNITPDQVKQMALAGLGSSDLTPGATKTFDYTFKDPAPAGKLEFACHLPGHYDQGMHIPIIVN
jgi:uncharacterized cupredoxin-like copper-binding protein